MRIAVVGAGVAGLTAARALDADHEIVLFEAERELGGHVHTVDVPAEALHDGPSRGPRPSVAVDTGFIVFNTRTYPRLCRMLVELGVETHAADMSFGVQAADGLAYGSRGFRGLFAQRWRLASARHWRMLADIPRFYRDARLALSVGTQETLGEFVRRHRYGDAFVEHHLLPLIGAIWSAGRRTSAALPARFVLAFFENHGFLDVRNVVPWRTVRGGARQYVARLASRLRGAIRRACRVRRVERVAGGVEVDGERFDRAILACHADQALALLAAPTLVERELLSAFPYQENVAVLHTDARVMPRELDAWSAWNVSLLPRGARPEDEGARGPRVTYWMNQLQPLATSTPVFVTLNREAEIAPSRVIERVAYAHPVLGAAALAAQARRSEMLSVGGVGYAGAYWRNGFHEDGVVSALEACAAIGGAG